ncbi:MAG: hypothetical protein R3D60_06665 [Paracoccaceae bacterium]
MSDILLPFGFLAFGVVMVALIARWQSARYQSYLDKHTAETRALVETQKQTLVVIERQTAALERIAVALESRG